LFKYLDKNGGLAVSEEELANRTEWGPFPEALEISDELPKGFVNLLEDS
jgi:hypothetical protein